MMLEWSIFPYALGLLTYHYWLKLKAEINRGEGGEIIGILPSRFKK